MSPYDLVRQISRLIDQAEISRNPTDFIEARRLLNNQLMDAIAVNAVSTAEQAVAEYKEQLREERKQYAANSLVALEKCTLDRVPAQGD